MATLTITKTYADNKTLFESSLTQIIAGVEKLLNTELLADSNFVNSTITAAKINTANIDSDYLEVISNSLAIKENAVTPEKLALSIRHAPVGTISMFHTFNGELSIPRGWMICNSTIVSESNYNSQHGAGAYAADNIAASAIIGKYLPGLSTEGAYVKGVSNTTETGATTLSSDGQEFLDTQHQHNWFKQDTNPSTVYTLASGYQSMAANGSGSYNKLQVTSTSSAGQFTNSFIRDTDTAVTFSNSNPTSISADPVHNVFIYIMKVV